MLRECAQSIPRLEKPKNRRLSQENSKMFDFRFNTSIPSLNQGQGLRKNLNFEQKFRFFIKNSIFEQKINF
jgi:hypothetical protein